MRIRTLFQGKHTVFDRNGPSMIVGRPKAGVTVDVDLSPDEMASRPHARIFQAEGRWWIEDLGSSRGTKVDGREIKGQGKTPLTTASMIRIGATVLRLEDGDATVDRAPGEADSSETWKGGPIDDPMPAIYDAQPTRPVGTGPPNRPTVVRGRRGEAVTISLVTSAAEMTPAAPAAGLVEHADLRQRVLYDLLLGFGADLPLDEILQQALAGLVKAIPAAERGAILVEHATSKKLLLKAHLPAGEPSVSETLAQRAIDSREGFCWQSAQGLSTSQIAHEMAAGMYAPMVWKGETFGVMCVDNSTTSREFTPSDLQLLVAAAQHAALAVANHRLRDELVSNASLTQRLLTNFSPAVRRRLLGKARNGRLRLGGEKSEVTILASDIRGFTRLTANMDAEDVVDMLNTYFSALVDAVFRHNGTIDKFIGDAILAVFGSPEPDLDQHSNAVRAALAMQQALTDVNAQRQARGEVVCEMGIGVHCGTVLHGFIGSDERMEFTVIGDAVNRTARYCDGAGAGKVLISPDVHQRVWKLVRTRPLSIGTKHEGDFQAFEVLECR